MKETSICIILARGGSKRIPLKNIIELKSKPLISWTIKAAIKSEVFDKVIVSTDSDVIAKEAKRHGADVPFLRNDCFDDKASASSATLCTLDQAEHFYKKKWKNIAQMMGNCPLVTARNIRTMYQEFIMRDIPSQISCFKYGWMNPWWACRLNEDGSYKRIFESTQGVRSQDLEELYCPSGALWLAKGDELRMHKSFYTPGHKMIEIPWKNAIDIDNYDDLEMARLVAKDLNMEEV